MVPWSQIQITLLSNFKVDILLPYGVSSGIGAVELGSLRVLTGKNLTFQVGITLVNMQGDSPMLGYYWFI